MKEEYKAVFDELTPDDALLDLKKPRRKMLKPAVALLLALILTGGILLHVTRTPATQPKNGETGASDAFSRQPRMVLIAGAETLPVGEEKTDGETFSAPLNYRLCVFDLKGLSEDERQALIDEKRAEFGVYVPETLSEEEEEEDAAFVPGEDGDGSYTIEMEEGASGEPDYILPFATEMLFDDVYVVIEAADAFTIRVPEATELLEVSANCENGAFYWFETHSNQENAAGTFRGFTNPTGSEENRTGDGRDGWGASSEGTAYDEAGDPIITESQSAQFTDNCRKMTVEGSFYKAANGYVKVVWFPSAALIRELAQNGRSGPFDLTGLRDTITFTAQFNDNTTETCVAALSFDAQGQMNVTVR